MRKLVLHMKVSVDGYVGATDGDVGWVFPSIDAEVTNWLVDVFRNAGTYIMGRVLTDDMVAYWPTSTEPYAAPMNEIPKVVFSKTSEAGRLAEHGGGERRPSGRGQAPEASARRLHPGSRRFTIHSVTREARPD